MVTNVSEEPATSIFKVQEYPEDGVNRYTTSHHMVFTARRTSNLIQLKGCFGDEPNKGLHGIGDKGKGTRDNTKRFF
jgi:hypothetical protein